MDPASRSSREAPISPPWQPLQEERQPQQQAEGTQLPAAAAPPPAGLASLGAAAAAALEAQGDCRPTGTAHPESDGGSQHTGSGGEGGGGGGGGELAITASRVSWAGELHDKFVKVCRRLGGAMKATVSGAQGAGQGTVPRQGRRRGRGRGRGGSDAPSWGAGAEARGAVFPGLAPALWLLSWGSWPACLQPKEILAEMNVPGLGLSHVKR